MSTFVHRSLHQRLRTRRYLVLGASAQDECDSTLSKSSWHILSSLSSVAASCEGRSGGESTSSSSSTWRRPFTSTSASVQSDEVQTSKQDWEECFADPLQWWDNRGCQVNPKSPGYMHKVTKKVLRLDDWSTPPWVKAMRMLMTSRKLPSHSTSNPQEIGQPNRSAKGNLGRRNSIPTSLHEFKQALAFGDGSVGLPGANATSGAIDILKKRVQLGIARESFTYVEILKRCTKPEDLTAVKQVHACAIEGGMQQNLYVSNNLLNGYIRCGRLLDARRVFDGLVKKDVISWNIMIGGYALLSCAKDAMDIFNQMRGEGVQADAVTYLSLLKACASPSALKWGVQIYTFIRQGGFDSDVRVANTVLRMYAKCGSIEEARSTFEKLSSRNAVSWNMMIGAYAENGCGEEAYRLLLRMKLEGFKPNAITYLSILNASASTRALDLEWVRGVHSCVREAELDSDVRVGTALVHMYANCGSLDDARLVFDRMAKRDVITWTTMIGALAQHGCGFEAFELFLRMKKAGLEPCVVTYLSILNPAASSGALEWVRGVHGHARDAGFESDVRVGNALVHMYSKCGSLDEARLAFDKMQLRNVITWTAMIGGLAQHGCGREALELFESMIAAGVKPDEYAFVALLSACNHAGLVDEGRRLFESMSQEHGVVPSLSHWNCMVDILGRAGHLEEAKLLIDSMPVAPDAATWGALLAACRSYANPELGELAAEERFKLDPKDPSTYVLLSNIYAGAENWDKLSLVRKVMQERGIRKESGRSWIEVDSKIHTFLVGDTSHPEIKEICAELSRLTEKIKAEGYLPDTRLVLHELEENEKAFSLCSHSEKLAIAYGLLHTPRSNAVRVYKNLRVCSDCHTASKLISKVTAREIVVRDGNRFHHFKDGLCSCKDYW